MCFSNLLSYFIFCSVARETLKNTHSRGVREKMEKAVMLLMKKASSATVDQAQAEPSRPKHTVSTEMLEENGGRVIEEPEKSIADGDGEMGTRKRSRVEDEQPRGPLLRKVADDTVGGGVNKTLTIIGNRAIMNPTMVVRKLLV